MKMETPKMDVVRFKEADVIVASGNVKIWTSTVSNSGGSAQDLTVAITSAEDGVTRTFGYDALYDSSASGIMGSSTYSVNGVSVKLSELIANDANASSNYINYNGYYESADGNSYTWKHQ